MTSHKSPTLSTVIESLCSTIDKEYERDVSHEVEFYDILLEAYLLLRSMHARKGLSRNIASTNSTGSTSAEDELNELGIAEDLQIDDVDIFEKQSNKSVIMKKEIADIPVNMMGKLLDSKEANLFLQSYISFYLQKISSTS